MKRNEKVSLVVSLVLTMVALALVTARVGSTPVHSMAGSHHEHMQMTDAEMKERSTAWFASHPPTKSASLEGKTAAVTVQTRNFQFDADGNLATVADTIRIYAGDMVTWQWVEGFHTATNGIDGGDPNHGLLFNGTLDEAHTTFSYTFNETGLIPYYCVVHEGAMSGYVEVRAVSGVEPHPTGTLGFTRDPFPNPSSRGFRFGFALSRPGHARAEVFDARGRRIAVPLDQDLPAGTHPGAWDGRSTDGGTASTGVYYLRLHLPGYSESRAVTVTR